MLRASILPFILALQIHASRFRNSSAVKPSSSAPAASNSKKDKDDAAAISGLVKGLNALSDGATGEAGAAMRRKYMTRDQALVTNSTNLKSTGQNKKKVEDKEEKEAITGLVNGLNKLPMRGGKVSPIGAKIANLKKAALVSSGNASNAHTPKAPVSKEDKENHEAIAGLVNGLSKLPMRDGKASPVAARMANLRNTALVSHAAPTAEGASKDADRIQRAQHALDKADAATQSVDQDASEARKDAERTKEALKTSKVTVLVSSKAPSANGNRTKTHKEDKEEKEAVSSFVNGLDKIPMKNGKISPIGVRQATRKKSALVSHSAPAAQKPAADSAKSEQKSTTKTQKEDKEEKEAVSSFVNGLDKIPMKNGKISPIGVRQATRKKSALVSHAAPPAQKPAAAAAKSEQKSTTKTQKEDKEEKEAVSSFVNGLDKIPMKNGKISPIGVRQATRKKSALVSHAAQKAQNLQNAASVTAPPVDARDAEQNKRIQHALEVADEEEKSVAQEEKEAHEEAEEARKIVKGSSK